MTETDTADRPGTGRTIAAIVAAVVVGCLASTAAGSFLMAASWSSIHGGMSIGLLVVLSLLGMALPPGLGLLAGRTVYRSWPKRQQRATPIVGALRLPCPHCGCSMKQTAEYSASPAYTVVKCPIHGPFHIGPGKNLTLGAPPQA